MSVSLKYTINYAHSTHIEQIRILNCNKNKELNRNLKNALNIPTHMWVDLRDELVSHIGIQHWVSQAQTCYQRGQIYFP